MADRIFTGLRTLPRNQVCLSGSWATNGTSAVSEVLGSGFSVERITIGEYEVTLEDVYATPVNILPTLAITGAGSTTNIFPAVENDYSSTTRKFTVHTIDETGNDTDSTGNRVGFVAWFDERTIAA